MIRVLMISLLCVQTVPAVAAEVVRVAPWEFHNSFWMSLHQTLMSDAMRSTQREMPGLSQDELKSWTAAVTAYRAAGEARDNITFTRVMIITNDAVTQIADDATSPLIDAPMSTALLQAAPVYRARWWTADQKANRFFIRYAAAMAADAGAELIRSHEMVYKTEWPQRVLVYVTPHAGPFGAYTMTGKAGGVITAMSSRDPGYEGLRSLEMLLHESSHAVVSPNRGTVATAIAAAAKQHGRTTPPDLWHALLFATSSELTRGLLAERGVVSYTPASDDLFRRAWPRYRKAVETHWTPYLNGKGTLDEAVAKVVADIPR